MFDLNERVDYELSVMNAESSGGGSGGGGGAGVDGASNAKVDDKSDTFTFNFDILKVDRDEMQRSTRQLFPATMHNQSQISSRAEDTSVNGFNYNTTYQYGLNGSAGSPGPKIIDVQQPQQVKKSRRGPRSKSSQYRGVTFYRRTGRWESHIWDCGKQVYLGGFDIAQAAARAYDKAAIKFRGVDADINFHISDYEQEMKLWETSNLTKEEFVHILRRESTGFARGSSKYRGVTLHKCGKWEARMGQLLGKKAYDKAALTNNGRDAVTNFTPFMYEEESSNQHNLDLNLGISAFPSKNSVMENSGDTTLVHPPLKELGLPSHYQHFPSYEERATRKRIETHSLQGSQTTWKMYGQLDSNPTTNISASAASSGFSSLQVNSASSSKIPYPPSYNLCFTSFPIRSQNASQDYYQIRSPPPPP